MSGEIAAITDSDLRNLRSLMTSRAPACRSRSVIVFDVTYAVHTKRDADDDAPKTMRVDYRVGFNLWQSEWVCFEHTGYARRKAEAWWRR